MNIQFFIYDLSGGGAERVVVNLANYLTRKKHKIKILTVIEGETAYNLDDGIVINYLSKKAELRNMTSNYLLWFKRLVHYVRGDKVDCYITMLLIPTKLMMLAHPLVDCKIIFSERNDPGSYPCKTQKWLRLLTKYADGFVFQTLEASRWYKDVVKEKKQVIIPNAVNSMFIKADSSVSVRKNKIVAIGRLEEQKNHFLLIDAFSDFDKSLPGYQLEIYGQGSLKGQLLQTISERSLSDKIFLKGYCSDVGEAIKDAALYVMSSNYEGMPNSLIEAMALGLPCIATDCPCGGPRGLIRDEINGVLVPVGDKKELAKAMVKMLSDLEKAREIGRAARRIVDLLNPDFIYNKWRMFIEAVVENQPFGSW